MSSDRFGLFRVFTVLFALVVSTGVLAQSTVNFQGLDVDANGLLSRSEFSRLPGLSGSPLVAFDK